MKYRSSLSLDVVIWDMMRRCTSNCKNEFGSMPSSAAITFLKTEAEMMPLCLKSRALVDKADLKKMSQR